MKKTVGIITVAFLILLVFMSVSPEHSVNKKYSLYEYITFFRPVAIKEMNRIGIPASITLAQAILESGFGNSELAMNANNHFGLKCKPEWRGATYELGASCYKKYSDAFESYKDHSNHIKSRKWYASLFNLKITDYKSWAFGLKKAGYAQDPYYAYHLIQIIDYYKFNKLDSLYNPEDTTYTK